MVPPRILLRMDYAWLVESWGTKTYLTKTTGSMSTSTTQWVHVILTYDNGTQLCSLQDYRRYTQIYLSVHVFTSCTGVHEAFLKAKLDHSVTAPNGKIYTFGQNEKIKIQGAPINMFYVSSIPHSYSIPSSLVRIPSAFSQKPTYVQYNGGWTITPNTHYGW